MKNKVLYIITLLGIQFLYGQETDVWIRFTDTAGELSGYKDLNGNIKISPRFVGPTHADSFYNIISVTEGMKEGWSSYYLVKDGRRVGKDSVFLFDFTFDCESEGKILFRDKKKNKVGFLDGQGVAVIPAVYDYALPFRNGIAVARQNAKRKCWGGDADSTHCEHWGWEGGETLLINDDNEILVDRFETDAGNVDWYSKRVNDSSVDTSTFVTIKGRYGNLYSFIDFEKEFTKWFYDVFKKAMHSNDTEDLNNLLLTEVTYWSEKEGWATLDQHAFLKKFPKAFIAERFQQSDLKQLSITRETLNTLTFESKLFKKYLNACGEHNKEKYPVFDVMTTSYKKRSQPLLEMPSELHREYEFACQEHFSFLRTEEGYKLLSVSLRK